MKYNTPNYSLRCLLCILISFFSSAAFSQDTTGTNELTPISRDQIDRGVECFRRNIRRGRRSKVTQQVTISYSTMQQLLNEANPDSNFQFILVAIDKEKLGMDTIFAKTNIGKTRDDLHNKQALVIKFASKTATAMNQPEGRQELRGNTEMTSSLKSAGNPLRQIAKNDIKKRNLAVPPFPPVRYAIGRLCPPPVCDQY